MTTSDRLVAARFHRSSNYHPEWITASASGGANALWLTEWLTEALELRPGQQVLDLGAVWRRHRSSSAVNSACRHWERTRILDIGVADTLADGWKFWRDWQTVVAPDNTMEIEALEADCGRYRGYVRLVGRRRLDARLDEPIVTIPATT